MSDLYLPVPKRVKNPTPKKVAKRLIEEGVACFRISRFHEAESFYRSVEKEIKERIPDNKTFASFSIRDTIPDEIEVPSINQKDDETYSSWSDRTFFFIASKVKKV